MAGNFYENAMALKALSDPNRLVIIELLKEGEHCACKILEKLDILQPTLSHHMKVLCEAELVLGRKSGKWMQYSLNYDKFNELKELMAGFSVPSGNVTKTDDCIE